jgi:hypothetical protein
MIKPLDVNDAHSARDFLRNLEVGNGSELPTHPQHSDVHCSAYALWNAVEVSVGRSIPKPEFIDIKMGKNGLSMTRLMERRAAEKLLRQNGLVATPISIRGNHEQLIMNALQQGVVLCGGVVAMCTYRSCHHPGGKKSWEGVRVHKKHMINHSMCVVGSAKVQDFGRCLLIRDSQREESLGVKGCAFLPMSDFEGRLEECFLLRPA